MYAYVKQQPPPHTPTHTLKKTHPSLQVLIPVTFNLLSTSVAIIYIGCHRSLALRDKGAATDEEPVETISKEVGGGVGPSVGIGDKYIDRRGVVRLNAHVERPPISTP